MRYMKLGLAVILGVLVIGAVAAAHAQGGPQVFKATATVKTAGGATATAPVTVSITRMMSKDEADKLATAFKTGGAEALKKALVGVKPTGTVVLGKGKPTPTRIAFERSLGSGRLITIVTDRPLLFLGAGVPGAKPTAGHDFAIIDLQVDDAGSGSGTMATAATVKVDEQGAFVVQDYGGELIRLTDVKKGS
jgi:hypothetical protein